MFYGVDRVTSDDAGGGDLSVNRGGLDPESLDRGTWVHTWLVGVCTPRRQFTLRRTDKQRRDRNLLVPEAGNRK